MEKKKSKKPYAVESSRGEMAEYMFDKMPNLTQITIPREVLDDMRLTANDKLLFGLIHTFRTGVTLDVSQICGLLCVSRDTYIASANRLIEYGMLVRRRRQISPTIRLANFYKTFAPPKRFKKGQKQPYYTKTDISHMEKDINDYFDEIEI